MVYKTYVCVDTVYAVTQQGLFLGSDNKKSKKSFYMVSAPSLKFNPQSLPKSPHLDSRNKYHTFITSIALRKRENDKGK